MKHFYLIFYPQLRDLTLSGFDTTSVPGRAVKYFSYHKTWYDAKSYCNNLECGGHLLTVNNGAANRWIMGRSRTWIGLNDLGVTVEEKNIECIAAMFSVTLIMKLSIIKRNELS